MTRPDRRACLLIIPHPRGRSCGRTAALTSDQCRSLLEDLAQLADPRQRRGRRHALVGVLGVAVCAVLAGAKSLARDRRVGRGCARPGPCRSGPAATR